MRLSQVFALLALVVPTTVLSADVAPLPKSVVTAANKQPTVATEPELTAIVKNYHIELKVKNVPKGTAIIWDSFPEDRAETRIIKVEQACILTGPPGEYRVKVRLVKGEDVTELRWQGKLTGGVTPPQPPPDIDPKPPNPKPPEPVTSFRVILIFESGDTLTPKQHSAIYGESIEKYLTAKTTKDGDYNGYRRRDKDASTTTDTPTFNKLWTAVKPIVTSTPCLAIAVNEKVEILPIDRDGKTIIQVAPNSTQTVDVLTALKHYAGDK